MTVIKTLPSNVTDAGPWLIPSIGFREFDTWDPFLVGNYEFK